MVPPASKATPRRPAAAAPRKVSGPIVGRSVRRSWPGLTSFTSTPPRPGRASAAAPRQHRVGALGRLDRQHDPLLHHAALTDIDGTECASHGDAAADVCHRHRIGAARDSSPAGPAPRSGFRAPRATRKPSSPNTLTTAANSPSSPAKAARPMRARMRAPSASGRRSSRDGRRTGPISTRSWQPCSRNAAMIRPAARIRTTSCGHGASTAGSAKPSSPIRNTSRRPRARPPPPDPAAVRRPPECRDSAVAATALLRADQAAMARARR